MAGSKEIRYREVSPGDFEIAVNEVVLAMLQGKGIEPTGEAIAKFKEDSKDKFVWIINSVGERRPVLLWDFIQHEAAVLAVSRVRLKEA